ncbi:MAG: hypothetical protein AAGA77_06280 [Bacteroidota bacterium]
MKSSKIIWVVFLVLGAQDLGISQDLFFEQSIEADGPSNWITCEIVRGNNDFLRENMHLIVFGLEVGDEYRLYDYLDDDGMDYLSKAEKAAGTKINLNLVFDTK